MARSFASLMSWIVLALPPDDDFDQAAWQTVFGGTPRIVVASMLAYFAGEFTNSYVLAKMKIRAKGRRLWARFVSSTLVGEGVNTVLFYGIALRGVLPDDLLLRGVLMGWTAKVLVEVVMLPMTYVVVRFLKKADEVDHYDVGTRFNPFLLG